MPNKPGGAPYPLPTDPVAQGAAAIDALAAFVDPSELTVLRPAALNVTSGAWGACGSWTASQDVKGNGLTYSNAGIVAVKAGRYTCEAFATIPGGAGTRRGIAVSSPGTSPVNAVSIGPPAASGNNNVFIAQTITVPAGGTITVWIFQDSAATLGVLNLQLTARRQP